MYVRGEEGEREGGGSDRRRGREGRRGRKGRRGERGRDEGKGRWREKQEHCDGFKTTSE